MALTIGALDAVRGALAERFVIAAVAVARWVGRAAASLPRLTRDVVDVEAAVSCVCTLVKRALFSCGLERKIREGACPAFAREGARFAVERALA